MPHRSADGKGLGFAVRPVLALLGTIAVLASVASTPAPASSEGAGTDVGLGGYTLRARANAIQLTYDSPGLLPMSPIIQVSVPESLATLATGPTGYALASVAWPGALLGDLQPLLEQLGCEAPVPVPGWPVRSEAYYPQGPTDEERQPAPGSDMRTSAHSDATTAQARLAGFGLPALVELSAVTTAARAAVGEGTALTTARTELGGVSLLTGLIRIESLVTDLTSTSDGAVAATRGGTTVGGITVAGFPAILDGEGLHLSDAGESGIDPALDAVTGPLRDVAQRLLAPLSGGLEPVNEAFRALLAQAGGTLNELLAQAGISVRMLEADETVNGGRGERSAPGISIDLDYDGRTAPVFATLLEAVPYELIPGESPPCGVPSAQALVRLLQETHLTSLTLGTAFVSAKASPAFVAPRFSTTPPPAASSRPAPGTGVAGTVLDSPSSPLSAAGVPDSGTALPVSGSASSAFALGRAISATAMILVLLSIPLFAAGSRRLADLTLAGAAGESCPLERSDHGRTD